MRRLITATVGLLIWSGTLHAVVSVETRYREALDMAGAGRHEAALPVLRRLAEDHPDRPHYLYDYITVLGWAERDAEVLALRSRVDPADAPVYVIETFAKSARNHGDFLLAVDLYRRALVRDPDRLQSRLGLALALADNGEYPAAVALLQDPAAHQSGHPDVLAALAYIYQRDERPFDALVMHDRVLRQRPADREARRQRILLTAELGAPAQAARLAQDHPDLLTPEEREKIRHARAMQSIHWGGLYNPDTRHADTDAAIDLLRDQLNDLEADDGRGSDAYRQAQFGLMLALRDRQRTNEVIAIYEELAAADVALPDYALLAAADAYMAERRPATARDIYLQLLERSPGYFDAEVGLFYAYFDNGEYARGLALIDRLAAEAEDPQRRLSTASRAAMARAWSGQLAAAQRRYEPLVNAAPNNPYLRAELGYVYLWRGWPRRAGEEFRISRAIEPEILDTRLGEIAVQRSRYEFADAARGVAALTDRYPDNRQILRLARAWEVHNMRELRVEFARSTSTAPQIATSDFALDTWLYSQPLNHHYRVFAHGHYANSRFPEGTGIYRRLGTGIEYRARDYELVGELSTGYGDDAGLGLDLRGAWMPDDFWTFGARLDTYSNDVPLRGRLNEDIDGWAAGVSADYTFHESRAVAVALRRLEFSDGNRRTTASAVGFQRLITGPVYRLDGRLGLYWSDNTRSNASYFNPDSDLATEASLTNEWLVFRRYSRSLVHRLGLARGSYRQSGFGSSGTWGINYEHEWNFDDRTYLLYGIARSRPVYDGAPETVMRYYLTLDWRF